MADRPIRKPINKVVANKIGTVLIPMKAVLVLIELKCQSASEDIIMLELVE